MELKQFKITVVPLRDKLLNYARRMTDDPSDAEDAVQEVMLKLWNLRQKLDEYRSIEAVAMTMTHHLCMDLWRAKRPDTLSLDRVQAPTPSATPERLLEEKDEFRLMREIIDSLPTLQRTIIRMKDIEEYETEEIAEITGLTVSGSTYIIQTIFDCLASGIYSRIYCAVNSLSHRLLNILGHLAVIFSRNCCVYDLFYFVSKFS